MRWVIAESGWLVVEISIIFFALGGFLSWLAWSIHRLRVSNHQIRNMLHLVAMSVEEQSGLSPLSVGKHDSRR